MKFLPDKLARSFVGVLIATFLVLVACFYFLGRQWQLDAERQQMALQDRSVGAFDNVREHLQSAGPSATQRHQAFAVLATDVRQFGSDAANDLGSAFAVAPTGAFIWIPGKGTTWQFGLDESMRQRVDGRRTWNGWTTKGRRPPRRALEIWESDGVPYYLLWGRVEDELYGFVFAQPPVSIDERTWIWVFGVLLIAMVFSCAAFAAWQLYRSSLRERTDNERKSRFVSDVSHELKTPLAAMGLWADMLASGRLPSEERRAQALAVIREEKDRMLRMVVNLLDYTRLEAHRRVYDVVDFDGAELVRATTELVAGDFPKDGLVVDVPPPGRVILHADRDAVKEIVLNLLSNAAKYAAAAGRVEVVLKRQDDKAVLTVADHGPGLSPEELRRVFTRFYRVLDENASSKGGFGLGLPIARGLARGMGGDLTACGRAKGPGLVFTLVLPVGGPACPTF